MELSADLDSKFYSTAGHGSKAEAIVRHALGSALDDSGKNSEELDRKLAMNLDS